MSDNVENISIREIRHIQNTKYVFNINTFSPTKDHPGARFSVETKVYITGVGWEIVNPTVKDNELLKALSSIIKMHELLGYKHAGISSTQLNTLMNNLWKE